MEGDQLVRTSETVVLEFPEQRKDCCHHAGSVEFAPDGNLFISTGDNTHPAGDSDGYAPIDERPGRDGSRHDGDRSGHPCGGPFQEALGAGRPVFTRETAMAFLRQRGPG